MCRFFDNINGSHPRLGCRRFLLKKTVYLKIELNIGLKNLELGVELGECHFG